MNVKEAIEIISKTTVAYPNPDSQGVWDEAIYIALSAMKKRIGKEPMLFYSEINDPFGRKYTIAHIKCPNEECDEQFEITETPPNCCPKCGQKIDWSE